MFIEVKRTNGKLCTCFYISLYEKAVLLYLVILKRKEIRAGLSGRLCNFGQ